MNFFKKYYIYFIELILGNIAFNVFFSIIKILTFKNIGENKETFINIFKMSFSETLIVYIIIYIIFAIIQILYDKSIVNKLNNKLEKAREGGNSNEK